MLLYPTYSDPLFWAIFQPLHRWAREVWLVSHPGPAHSDALTAEELTAAAHRILMHEPMPLPQGPLLATYSALDFLKWNLAPPCGITDANGNSLDLSHGSPSLLTHYVRVRFQEIQESCLESRLALRPNSAVQSPHWPLVRRFLDSKRPNKKQKASLLSTLYGTLPTPSWRSLHGWDTQAHCDIGHSLCDFTHLVHGCHPGQAIQVDDIFGRVDVPPRTGLVPLRATVHGW
jgi:hypothetical protein